MAADPYYSNYRIVNQFRGTRCNVLEVVFNQYDFEKPACAVIKAIPNAHPKALNELNCTKLASEVTDVAVRFYEVLNREDEVLIIQERCHRGNLLTFLKDNPNISLTEKLEMCMRLARGLFELHAAHLAHRDIKPENILLNSRDQVVYCDFGESKVVDESDDTSTIVGTPQYLDPSIYETYQMGKRNTKYSPYKNDVWCLGRVLVEIMAGRVLSDWPMKVIPQDSLHVKVETTLVKSNIPRQIITFIQHMLSINENERPTSREICEYFHSLTLPADLEMAARYSLINADSTQIKMLLEDSGPSQPEFEL
mmetsp:Transcript_32739/g.56997  ORF Transcript_32739/g.56997 Transcript_32739/m.56997 type:complete len:309 (-) Transcript_32739:4067-4993(-)